MADIIQSTPFSCLLSPLCLYSGTDIYLKNAARRKEIGTGIEDEPEISVKKKSQNSNLAATIPTTMREHRLKMMIIA